jgi:hypothetical protein
LNVLWIMGKRILFWFLWILVAVLSVTSARTGISDFSDAVGVGQRLVSYGGFTAGAAGIAVCVGMLLRRNWTLPCAILCFAGSTLAAALAPVAYGNAPLFVGIASGLAALLVLVLIYMGIRRVIS